MDFIQIVNVIFENKNKYQEISDKEKSDGFFMINKKFLMNSDLLNICNSFNIKNVDRASAIDLYYLYFKNKHNIPGWYWKKSPYTKIKKAKKLSKSDKELIINEFKLTEQDFDFLIKNYKDDIDYELKILKKFK